MLWHLRCGATLGEFDAKEKFYIGKKKRKRCSFQGHLNFSGKHSATLQLREDFVHISTTVGIAKYSFIQLCELWHGGVIKLAKGSNRPQWDLKLGSLD